MKIQILFTILFVALNSSAFNIGRSTNVSNFIDSHYIGKTHGYRSGDIDGTEMIAKLQKNKNNLDKQIIGDSTDDQQIKKEWMDINLPEFAIDENPSKCPIRKIIDVLSTVFEVKANSGCEFTLLQKPTLFPINYNTPISSDKAIKIADQLISNILPKMDSYLEFHNISTEYVNDSLTSYTLRYRRIFHGGIICGNVSYVDLFISNTGVLTRIDIKWPQLIRKEATLSKDGTVGNKKVISLIESAAQIEGALQAQFSHIKKIAGENSTDVNAQIGEIKGVSFAWKKVEGENGQFILTPCYSYLSEIKYDDSHVESIILDVPVYSEYLNR